MSNNLENKTSLVITVHFDPNPVDPNPHFSYSMVQGSHGWKVDQAGNITPPPRKRVIRFQLAEGSQAKVYGLRFARLEQEFPTEPSKFPWFNESALQAVVPMTEASDTSVSCILETQSTRLVYQFGVDYDGKIFWDDPRIYSDGSI